MTTCNNTHLCFPSMALAQQLCAVPLELSFHIISAKVECHSNWSDYPHHSVFKNPTRNSEQIHCSALEERGSLTLCFTILWLFETAQNPVAPPSNEIQQPNRLHPLHLLGLMKPMSKSEWQEIFRSCMLAISHARGWKTTARSSGLF